LLQEISALEAAHVQADKDNSKLSQARQEAEEGAATGRAAAGNAAAGAREEADAEMRRLRAEIESQGKQLAESGTAAKEGT
jgi:hypothetical protein